MLRERLSARASNEFGRTSEVQKWVFSWKKWWENYIKEKGAIVIDASHPLHQIANDIIERSKSFK